MIYCTEILKEKKKRGNLTTTKNAKKFQIHFHGIVI